MHHRLRRPDCTIDLFDADSATVHQTDLWIERLGRFRGKTTGVGHKNADRIDVHFFGQGKMRLEADGNSHFIAPGDLFAYFPSMRITRRERASVPNHHAWVTLSGASAEEVLAHLGITRRSPHRRLSLPGYLEPLFVEIEHTYGEGPHSPLYPSIAAWRLVEKLERMLGRLQGQAMPSLAQRAMQLIEMGITGGVSVKMLCAKLAVSRATLLRKFAESYRTTPKQVIDRLRIEQARRLLAQTSLSIVEVARRSGYRDVHHFSRMFLKKTGLRPSRYREDVVRRS